MLAKIWLPWPRPLNPCNQKYLIWIGSPQKPPVISDHILVISRRNAYITIFLRQLLVAMLTALCSFYGSFTGEFTES